MSEGNAAESWDYYIPNHVPDAETGFLESNGFPHAFDAVKKVAFLKAYKQNGLKLYRTCDQLGIKHETVRKHFRTDPAFQAAIDEAKTQYYDELEGVSRENALNPRSVIERIFQLKAAFPEKYGDGKRDQGPQVVVNIDASLIGNIAKRIESLDAQAIEADVIPNDVPDRPL